MFLSAADSWTTANRIIRPVCCRPAAPHTEFGYNLCRMLHQTTQGMQAVLRCKVKRLEFAKESETFVESKGVVAHLSLLAACRVTGAPKDGP